MPKRTHVERENVIRMLPANVTPSVIAQQFRWHARMIGRLKKRFWKIGAMSDRLHSWRHRLIFTFLLRVFKWTFTFEMWFIPSWINRCKPHPHTRHLSGLTSSPSNNVACLLTFAWRWTRIAMTLSAEIWRFGYSKPYVMSDLIQNIWKTSQVRWKLKIDTWLIILNVNISNKFHFWNVHGIMNTSGLLQS